MMLAGVKKRIARVAQKYGYEIIPSYRLEETPLCRHLRGLFRRTGIDLVIDVGAHFGEYAQFLRDQVEFEGQIISVEPIGDNFRVLEQTHRATPRWTGVNIALGPERTKMRINVTKDTQFASFHTPSQAGRSSIGNAQMLANTSVERTEEVEVDRLDNLLAKYAGTRPSPKIYLKLDTQGFDLKVIAGLGGWRDRVLAMQSEISMIPLYDGIPSYAESIRTYGDLGFDVTGFFPVSRDEKLRVIEFDCTLISRRVG